MAYENNLLKYSSKADDLPTGDSIIYCSCKCKKLNAQ